MAADSTVQYLNRFLQSHPTPSLLHLASIELPPSAHLGFFRQLWCRIKGTLEGRVYAAQISEHSQRWGCCIHTEGPEQTGSNPTDTQWSFHNHPESRPKYTYSKTIHLQWGCILKILCWKLIFMHWKTLFDLSTFVLIFFLHLAWIFLK